jgi:hypothetical protein
MRVVSDKQGWNWYISQLTWIRDTFIGKRSNDSSDDNKITINLLGARTVLNAL